MRAASFVRFTVSLRSCNGRWLAAGLLLAVATIPCSRAGAVDVTAVGRRAVVRGPEKITIDLRPAEGGFALPAGADDPTVAGATLRVFDTTMPGAGSASWKLPAENWTARGTPPGSAGYTYRATNATEETHICHKVSLTPERLKVVCVNTATAMSPPYQGDLGAVLEVGSDRYCGTFGGIERQNDQKRFKRNSAPAPSACPQITAGRPNFLVINLDDARADGLDKMPVFAARIQNDGVTFTNAYTPFPSCCSSRASLLTGNYSRTHGVLGVSGLIGGAHRFRETGSENQTIAVWLRNAGYETGLFGKYLNAYAQNTEGYCNIDLHIPPGWTHWRALLSPERYGGIDGAAAAFVDEAHRCTFYERGGCSNNGAPCCIDSQCAPPATCTNPTPESRQNNSCAHYTTDLTAEQMRDFIADSATSGRSFFAYWTPIAPHVGYQIIPIPAAEFRGTFAGLPVFRPPNYNIATALQPRWTQFAAADPLAGSFTDQIRVRAYETLLSVDKQLDIILDQLVDLGIDKDTVVLLTSDNGVGWGEHRWFFQTKACPYDMCQRVPFAVRYPRGITAPGTSSDATVLNIDIAPTLASLAGIAVPVPVEGLDASGWITGPAPGSWRQDYLMEHFRAGPIGSREDRLHYYGNPVDGDQIRVFFGDPLVNAPRNSAVFEFDSGDGTAPGVTAVAIAATDFDTLRNFGIAIAATIPQTSYINFPGVFYVTDQTPEHYGVVFWGEVDQTGVFDLEYDIPDYFGVRDVVNGFSWVEYETGERELYDLIVDPYELTNVADDPGYATTRALLEARLDALLSP